MGNVVYEAPDEQYVGFLKITQGEVRTPGWPLNSSSVVLEKSRAVKAGGGYLYGFYAFSTNVAAQFVMLFDATEQPADGTVTPLVFPVAAADFASGFWGDIGRHFERGIWICNSTTAASLTLGAADTLFDAQYI